MAKKILLVEQHRNRGFESNLIIGAYLKKIGYRVQFSFTGSQLVKNIVDFKPDLVYYPWVTKYVYSILKKRNPEVPIVNSFKEQNGILAGSNLNDRLRKNFKYSDYVLVWGNMIKNKMESEGLDTSKVSITGVPRFDLYFNEKLQKALVPSKSEIAAKFKLPLNKKWCLIALDFPILFQSPKRVNELINRRVYTKEYINQTQKAYSKLGKWLRKYLSRHSNVLFIIRPHPGSNLKQIKADQDIEDYDNVRYISNGTINKWIINCDKYITRFSTSITEAWMAKKSTLLLMKDLLPDDYKNHVHIKESKFIANDYIQFEKSLLKDKQYANHNKFLKNYIYKLDGKSCYRTAKAINKIANRVVVNEYYTSYFLEDNIEKIKANIKVLLNETGLNKYNPFERPNEEHISSKKITSKLKTIEECI
ncbi:hypothetical protein [Sporohalobacter salinus]|uniref:hypothetical protein n=1 Tax=Sporohalobacter salinus TaxID=1494606 RepID=UPI0019613314|nr:hypothetical protein [Sporohalobacter salinus]MBM7622977.1 surface carbohydrate biosynthesis protein [Sporohalobacter salinus]